MNSLVTIAAAQAVWLSDNKVTTINGYKFLANFKASGFSEY